MGMLHLVSQQNERLLYRKEIRIHPEPKGLEIVKMWASEEAIAPYLARTKMKRRELERSVEKGLAKQLEKKQEAMSRRKEREPRSYIVDYTEYKGKLIIKMYRNIAG